MQPEQIIQELAKDHSFTLSERIADSRNVTFFVTKIDGSNSVLKTHPALDKREYLQNEIEFLKLDILKTAPFKVPPLLQTYEIDEYLILEIEYIDGESFKSFQKSEKFTNIAIPFLAEFCEWIETLRNLSTVRSINKRKVTDEEWNKVFFENLKKWRTEILLSSQNESELVNLLDNLEESAQTFDMNKVGRGGIHGSAKMQEFIVKDSDIFVVDWETASSEYIRFYQTASIASYLLVRVQDEKAFTEFMIARRNLLNEESRKLFDTHFKSILSQRIVGDMFDLVTIEKKQIPVLLIRSLTF